MLQFFIADPGGVTENFIAEEMSLINSLHRSLLQ